MCSRLHRRGNPVVVADFCINIKMKKTMNQPSCHQLTQLCVKNIVLAFLILYIDINMHDKITLYLATDG